MVDIYQSYLVNYFELEREEKCEMQYHQYCSKSNTSKVVPCWLTRGGGDAEFSVARQRLQSCQGESVLILQAMAFIDNQQSNFGRLEIARNTSKQLVRKNEDLSPHTFGGRVYRLESRDGLFVALLQDHTLRLTGFPRPFVKLFGPIRYQ